MEESVPQEEEEEADEISHQWLQDAHFLPLKTSGNLYTMTALPEGGKILCASRDRDIWCLEYTRDFSGALMPSAKNLQFTYIPGIAEIISIDALKKSPSCGDFVVGIAIVKPGEGGAGQYLNIYSEWAVEPNAELSLDSIAQTCQYIPLNFMPMQLCHTSLSSSTSTRETVWLLSGSDCKIHLYVEDKDNHTYNEQPTNEHFPEFMDLTSVVLWMDIHYYSGNKRRLSAFGCENGYVRVSMVDTKQNYVVESYEDQWENPISSVRIYRKHTFIPVPDQLAGKIPSCQDKLEDFSLLVTNTINASVVYSKIMESGLANCYKLPFSAAFDCVTCSLIADIDMDGENEILLGTYGQEILIYKCINEEWHLICQRSLAAPIHQLLYIDLTNDGVKELVALTVKGVHLLQHDMDLVRTIGEARLEKLMKVLDSTE